MASNLVWKSCRPPVFRQLASLRFGAGIRRFYSSDPPPENISRYPVPNKKDLPYDIVDLMEEVESKGGFLPNVFKVLSHRPAEFRAFFGYYNELMNKETGGLTKADLHCIAYTLRNPLFPIR
ncbi:hypothetical protein PBY51_015962 [Eleginops maclovinus]|uniref:Uncharacterized protein n=1 Tax=Eleginops maclovinus TaxID=56733 RepID=A0AAN8AJB5_ELEMC|nr:hypothetical protein PBY51_015962 [Eleginops maclovinus]